MAHEIETMTFSRATPWHGLGRKMEIEDGYSWETVAEKSGLNWGVELVPLMTSGDEVPQMVPQANAVRRATDKNILGVVGPKYVPLQNKIALGWFQPFLDAKEAVIETAGSLKGGSRIFALARINRDPMVIAGDDIIEKFILLSHAHDGTMAIRVGFTPIRVVCANTLALAHNADASKLIRIRHTKQAEQNLEAIREVMNVANQEFETTAKQYRFLASRHINVADLKKYVSKIMKVEEGDEVSTRTKNVIEKIIGLAESGRGNTTAAVRGTWWTAYNGVNEYLSYEFGRNADNRLDSLWFGNNANLNRTALEVALDMAA